MASKKDFGTINTGRVYDAIDVATNPKGKVEADPQEQLDRAASMRTQGRKGCKAYRINMAFSPANYEFIRVMARATGYTMTKFANKVVEAYINEHPELMEQAQSFLDTVNSGLFSRHEPASDFEEQTEE